MTKFAYVVACYFGDRMVPSPEYLKDRQYFLRRQLDFLYRHTVPDLAVTAVILNAREEHDDVGAAMKAIQETVPPDFPFEFFVRRNTAGSYGAWEAGVEWLLAEHPEVDYAMLIEDDYLPVRPDFLQLFREHLPPDAVYVCQQWGMGMGGIMHPAMSNGMLDMRKAREWKAGNPHVFSITHGANINDIVQCQIHFLDYLQKKWRVVDVGEHGNPFKNEFGKCIAIGGWDDIILYPV